MVLEGRNVIIAIIAVAVVIFVIYYLVATPQGIIRGISTTSAVSINSSGTTTNSTTSTFSIPTTAISTSSCRANQASVPIRNGYFSTGTYSEWNVTGQGFGTQPQNASQLNSQTSYYGSPWSGLNGDYFASTYTPGLVRYPGNLTSVPFLVVEPYLNFKLISPQNAQLYIEITQGNHSVITSHFNTYVNQNPSNASSHFLNASIPLSSLLCQNVSIRVVAAVVGTLPTRTQYIAVSDFYQSSTYNMISGILVNQTYN